LHQKLIHMSYGKTGKCITVACLLVLSAVISENETAAQDFLPWPPADRASVYFLNTRNELIALPFEVGRTQLGTSRAAKETKVGFIELTGEHAATTIETANPRIFLFTSQGAGRHPPFLVLLIGRHESRRITAVAQKGLTGYAIVSEQIIKPNVRVLATAGEQVFMEIRPRTSLMPGEYAIIGDDLARIATFRIPAGKQ
jgi:hypothetical protein